MQLLVCAVWLDRERFLARCYGQRLLRQSGLWTVQKLLESERIEALIGRSH
jgi:hypothetical protein